MSKNNWVEYPNAKALLDDQGVEYFEDTDLEQSATIWIQDFALDYSFTSTGGYRVLWG